MGLYLEERAGIPPTKAAWLKANGREVTHITQASPWLINDDDVLGPEVLCAQFPGHFEAVAVMWGAQEVRRCVRGRPDASWWRVPLAALPPSLIKNIGAKAEKALAEWKEGRRA